MKHRPVIIEILFAVTVFFSNTYAQQDVVKVSPDPLNSNSKRERDPAFRDAKSVKIIVSQSYGNADKISLPFKEPMARLLQYAGLKEDSVNYEMVVRIDATGQALGANYTGQINGFNYTGASLKGSILYEARSGEKYSEVFNDEEEPSPKIYGYGCSSPNDAPFLKRFNKVLPTLMMSVYKPLGISPFIAALKDNDKDFCDEVIEALGRIKDGRAVDFLITALKDQNSHTRQTAARALGNIKDKRAVEPLIVLLNDQNEFVRLQVDKALDRIDTCWRNTDASKNAIPIFIAALKDKNGNVHRAAAYALFEIKDNRAIEPLIAALKDHDNMVRQIAAIALGTMIDNKAIEPLIATLKDQDEFVRNAARKSLDKIDVNWRNSDHARNALPLFIAALKDKNSDVRKAAAEAFKYMGTNWTNTEAAKNGAAVFISELKNNNSSVRKIAAEALGSIKDNRAVEPLIASLKDPDSDVRRIAVWSLADLNDSRAVGPLISSLKDPDSDVRRVVANVLAGSKDRRAIEPLIEVLKDQDITIRNAASRALSNITGRNLGDNYSKWQEWWEKNK